jgi:Putative beta-barrel porin-2, OmpL-like. bbp2
MKTKYIVLVSFLLLLLGSMVASAQTNAPRDGSVPDRTKPPKSMFDTYVKRSPKPLYAVASSSASTVAEEKSKGETPKVAAEADTDDKKPVSANAGSAAKPAIEEEIDALKARLADLEKRLEEQPPAAAAPQEKPAGPPEGLQEPPPGPAVDNDTPFAFGDFTWLNGNARTKAPIFDTKFYTPEIRFDTHYMVSFNQPRDHTLGGSTEMFRSGEFQLEQISVGGDFHWNNVRGRVLYMGGLFAVTTPRNDASPAVGQWDITSAYKYTSEAWGGYHFDVAHGLNVDAGIFVSYIGLFSYYNFDNWTYQPSYVSSNTPWFFNGLRIQYFPTNKLKIEPWIINGWQSYYKYNGHKGLGGQILWQPKEWFKLVLNNYGNGEDTLGVGRSRIHADDSIEVRYYNKPESTGISKMAFSLTGDAGCEYGGGVNCHNNKNGNQKQMFLGWMGYARTWFHKDLFAVTYGGGQMTNPGRYLTLLPPINGATAVTGSPYFPESPGLAAHMWDTQLNLQYMPKQNITFWTEGGYRSSDIPYFTGRGGITPPNGNNGVPTQYACIDGTASGASDLPTATTSCKAAGGVWFPDLRKTQGSISAGILVKF